MNRIDPAPVRRVPRPCRIRVSSVAKVVDEQRRLILATDDLGVGPLSTGFTG